MDNSLILETSASHGRLWMGGQLTAPEDYEPFDVVVDLYSGGFAAHVAPKRKVYVAWQIDDGEMPDPGTVRKIAQLVSGALDSGREVLVHCGAGLNRSGLVCARVLVGRGVRPADAIEWVRQRRPNALGNQYFVRWLLGEDAGF